MINSSAFIVFLYSYYILKFNAYTNIHTVYQLESRKQNVKINISSCWQEQVLCSWLIKINIAENIRSRTRRV